MNSKQKQPAPHAATGSRYETVRKFTVVKAGVLLNNVKKGTKEREVTKRGRNITRGQRTAQGKSKQQTVVQ